MSKIHIEVTPTNLFSFQIRIDGVLSPLNMAHLEEDFTLASGRHTIEWTAITTGGSGKLKVEFTTGGAPPLEVSQPVPAMSGSDVFDIDVAVNVTVAK